MPTRIEIHPTAKVAAYTVGCTIIVAWGIFALQRPSSSRVETPSERGAVGQTSVEPFFITSPGELLIPIIDLEIVDPSQEKHWSIALASLLSGQTEVSVEGGRVDVLTEYYAIEVDRLEKWHEAIGQAAHYSLKTAKIPTAAIIVPSDSWPMSKKTLSKLLLIDETCLKQDIKLILLRRSRP